MTKQTGFKAIQEEKKKKHSSVLFLYLYIYIQTVRNIKDKLCLSKTNEKNFDTFCAVSVNVCVRVSISLSAYISHSYRVYVNVYILVCFASAKNIITNYNYGKFAEKFNSTLIFIHLFRTVRMRHIEP